MVHAAQRVQADMSLGSNTRFGPQNTTAILRVLEIIVDVIFSHCTVGVMMRDRGVKGVTLLSFRWRTRQSR